MQHQTIPVSDTPSPLRQAGLDHLIGRIAQALFEARGCVEGHALDDWLQAEALVELTLSDLGLTDRIGISSSHPGADAREACLRRPSTDVASQPWTAWESGDAGQ